MITLNENNLLEIQNEKGTLRMERDDALGVRLTVQNPFLAVTMTGLYQVEELTYILSEQPYARIKHGYFSPFIGSKKILETIFSVENTQGQFDQSITFLSDDTTYPFPLDTDEWNEVLSLFRSIIENA